MRRYFVVRFQVIRQNSLRSLIKGWEAQFQDTRAQLAEESVEFISQGRPPYQSGQLSFIGKITDALAIVFQRQ